MWLRIAAAVTSCRFFADSRSRRRIGGEEKRRRGEGNEGKDRDGVGEEFGGKLHVVRNRVGM